MSGYLDNLNFDSDEDFEETAAGRAGARPADSQHEAAGDGGRGRGIGGAVAVGLGHRGRGRGRGGGVIEGFSQVAGPSRGRGGGQPGRGGRGVGGQVGGAQGDLGDQRASPTSRDLSCGGVGRGAGGRGGGAQAEGGRGGGQGGRRAKFRNWCVTINNYTGVPDAEFLKGPPPIKYLCFGKEVSSTGTPHLQMYVSFVNAVAQPSQYFRRFGNGHFIPANGTADQNAEYCSKEGDFTEFGTRPQSQWDQGHHGARGGHYGAWGGQHGGRGGDMEIARWEMAYQLAKEGRIEEIPADIRLRHYSTVNKIAAKYQKAPPKLSKMDNLWIFGPPGTGKSTFVHNEFPGAFKKSFTKWWCGYNPDDEGHRNVILDDLHLRWGEKELLKNWADVFRQKDSFISFDSHSHHYMVIHLILDSFPSFIIHHHSVLLRKQREARCRSGLKGS